MVDEFRVITVMTEALLRLQKDNNSSDYEKTLKIKELLDDRALFFKITKERAMQILKYIGIRQDQLEEVYQKLISSNVFYDLVNKGIIRADDKELIVKYKVYRQ